MPDFSKITSFFAAIIGVICMILDVPYYPTGKPLDLSGYEVVWEDEFDGDAIDTSVWTFHGAQGYARRGYVMDPDAVEVADGCAYFRIRYYADGLNGGKPGYYLGLYDTSATKNFTYGYFETRAVLPRVREGSGAFWLQNPDAYDHELGSSNGAEIDIMESQNWSGGGYYGKYFGKSAETVIEHNIHYDSGDTAKRMGAKGFKVRGNPYSEFHTYGVLWDEKGYTFYIDGVQTMHTSFGVSNAPEYICLSCDLRGEDGVPAENAFADLGDTAFIVDYVRVWQRG